MTIIPKRLQLSRHIQFAVGGLVKQNFSQVRRAPFRRNGPQNIGQELGAKLGGRFQIVKLNFNLGIAFLGFDFGFAVGFGLKGCAREINFGGASAMPVVDGLGASCNNIYSEDRYGARLLNLHCSPA